MKKLVLTLLLAVSLAIPSLCFAGDGATKYYGYFYDNGSQNNTTDYDVTWIQAANRNSNTATFTIKYYDYDGNLLGTGGYPHTVNQNQSISWYPRQDLYTTGTVPQYLSGSYVIEVTTGSIYLKSWAIRMVGDNFGDSAFYSKGDQVGMFDIPTHTVTSTYLNLCGFNVYKDKTTVPADERNIHIHITNPNDYSAKVKFTLYDDSGSPVELATMQDDLDTDSYSYTFTIPPHGNVPLHADDLFKSYVESSTGSLHGTYSVVVDAIEGSVTGNYIIFEEKDVAGGTNGTRRIHKTVGGSLDKKLVIQ
jgi:hypothetical protein